MSNYTYTNKQSDSIFEDNNTNIMDSLALALVLAKATTIARLGMLKQAETILQPISITSKATEDVYVLLAKIKAQQGKYFESKQMWQRVLTKNPFHTEAKKAINKINGYTRKAQKSKLLRIAIVFGFLFNGGLIYFNWSMNNNENWSLEQFQTKTILSSVNNFIESIKTHEYVMYFTESQEEVQKAKEEIKSLPEFQLLSPENVDLSMINNKPNNITTPTNNKAADEAKSDLQQNDLNQLEKTISILKENSLVKRHSLKVQAQQQIIYLSGSVPSIRVRNSIIQLVLNKVDRQFINADNLFVIATYTVQKGDSLWIIADKFYKDPHKYPILAKHNNISTSNPLWVGLKIEIPNPIVETLE